MSTPANRVIPLKIGFFGEQGTGKTATAALLAAALSKEFHNGAPVWVTDPEVSWQFPRHRIFRVEGVELVQRTVPTFKAMLQDLQEAERAGACVWSVELAKPWLELLKTVQKKCGDRWGQELVSLWGDFVSAFLNSPLHTMALARVSDLTEDVENERGEIKRLKTGEGMKAGGQRNNFGYEPHLVLRMSLERKPRRKQGKLIVDDGRMIHRADVLKDRTWELNGKVFRWPDKDGYKPGGYRQVWQSIEPHFRVTQEIEQQPILDTAASSAALVDAEGNSHYSRDHETRQQYLEDWDATMELNFGGRTAAATRLRLVVGEAITGTRSRSVMENKLTTAELMRSVLWLRALELRLKDEGMPADDPTLLTMIHLAHEDMEQLSVKKFEQHMHTDKGAAQPDGRPQTTLEHLLRKSAQHAEAQKKSRVVV